MEAKETRGKPGPKRARILDWIPRVEYCGDCGRQIVWHERITDGTTLMSISSKRPPQAGTGPRFKRCCDCAAAMWARRGRAAA